MGLDADRDVTVSHRAYELEEVAVTDEDVVTPSAIDVTALACKREERRIDQELFVAVRFAGARELQTRRRLTVQDAGAIDRDIPNVRRDREKPRVVARGNRLHTRCVSRAAQRCNPLAAQQA